MPSNPVPDWLVWWSSNIVRVCSVQIALVDRRFRLYSHFFIRSCPKRLARHRECWMNFALANGDIVQLERERWCWCAETDWEYLIRALGLVPRTYGRSFAKTRLAFSWPWNINHICRTIVEAEKWENFIKLYWVMLLVGNLQSAQEGFVFGWRTRTWLLHHILSVFVQQTHPTSVVGVIPQLL